MEKLFAVLGMLCNAGKDSIFKVAASAERGSHTTLFYGLKGAIIVLLSLVILLLQGKPLVHPPTLPWAFPLGVLTMATYSAALRSLVEGDASMSVTVFRLNFVLSTAAAALLLGEQMTARKLAGLGLSLAAVLVFFVGSRLQENASAARTTPAARSRSILLAVLACVSASALNITNKFALNAGVSIFHLIMYRYVVVCMICGIWLAAARRSAIPSRRLLLTSASSAVLMLAGLFFALTALSGSEVSIVIPILSLSFLFTAILSFVILREKLSVPKLTGIAIAAASIVLIG